MNLKNMSYGTLLGLIIVCIIDSIENKFNNLFVKKPEKVYRYFSGFVFGTFSDLFTTSRFQQIESTSNNIRYDPTSDTWEVFTISHNDFNQNTDIHQGRRGYWIIIDDEQKIRTFRQMFLEKTNVICTPTIQM